MDFQPLTRHSGLTKKFLRALEEAFAQRAVVFAAELGELFQFLALFVVQMSWHFHQQPRVEIAPVAAIDLHDSFAAKTKTLSALRPGRHFQARLAFQRRHRHFSTEGGSRERDRHFAEEIIFLALENRVFLDVDNDVKVAVSATSHPRFAIAAGAQTRAVRDAGRDLDFYAAGFLHPTFAMATLAGPLDYFAKPMTVWAGLRHLKKSA